MEGFAYFSAIVYRDERPEWVKHLSQVTKNYRDRATQNRPVEQKDWPLLQTENMIADSDVKYLVDYLTAACVSALQDQGYSTDKYDFYLSGLWGQDIVRNGATNVHVHKNSQMCGWLFLETPENGAYPVFYDPRMNKAMIELDYEQGGSVSNATSLIHFNNVKPGTVLFANSWLQHQLSPSTSDMPSRTIHFIVSHRDKEPMCNMS